MGFKQNKSLCVADGMQYLWPWQMVRSLCTILWMLHRTCWIMWEMLYHTMPSLCTLCHLVTRMLYCPIFYVWHLPSQYTSWLPDHGYWLDTYYHSYTMPGQARFCTWAMVPLSKKKSQEKNQAKGVYEVYSIVVNVCKVCPLASLSNFKNACPWLLINY